MTRIDGINYFSSLRGKYEELKFRERNGDMNSNARSLLAKLREYFEKSDKR